MRVREVGDSALLLELEIVVDPDVNARAIGIAAALRRQAISGVRDVVSTFHSVAVFFDPLSTDVSAVGVALHQASDALSSGVVASGLSRKLRAGRTIEVPVAYGGEFGPDLDAVAAFAGCSAQAVIDRHASRTYRVYMFGFLPGFAYMASVDDSIAAPRRSSPRARVPAGSVGIAGLQTGVYPFESPGGWQIIGRTLLEVFDANQTPAAMFAPGDQVRFIQTTIDRGANPVVFARASLTRLAPRADVFDRFVTVLRPGLLTTVQDSGRWGHQDRGVPVSGAMDPVAHRLANAIVGNQDDAATLEATLLGPELRIEQDTMIAIAGADLRAVVDGSDVPLHAPVPCRGGSVLRFGDRRSGARAYVAFDGGIEVPRVLGSRSTHLLSGLGGIEGRAALAGDRIPLGPARADLKVGPYKVGVRVRADLQVGPSRGGARLRILPGPQADAFTADAFDLLRQTRFTVSTQSDRMGYRLTGGAVLRRVDDAEMISGATFLGSVQVPPSGEPILLMADRQTTGGYPQIAVVITADLPKAAQLAPGDWVELEACTRRDAVSALIAQEGKLLAVR